LTGTCVRLAAAAESRLARCGRPAGRGWGEPGSARRCAADGSPDAPHERHGVGEVGPRDAHDRPALLLEGVLPRLLGDDGVRSGHSEGPRVLDGTVELESNPVSPEREVEPEDSEPGGDLAL